MSWLLLTILNAGKAQKKWKTTEKAVSAAEQKVVENTATQETDRTRVSEATDLADLSVKTQSVREGHSEKTARDQEDHSEKADLSEREASEATGLADLSVRTQNVLGDRSEKTAKDQEDHSVRTMKGQEDSLARTAKDQEDHHSVREVSETESQGDSEIPAERASTEMTSTISVTRTRAESTR